MLAIAPASAVMLSPEPRVTKIVEKAGLYFISYCMLSLSKCFATYKIHQQGSVCHKLYQN
jgi:hypothetical protein